MGTALFRSAAPRVGDAYCCGATRFRRLSHPAGWVLCCRGTAYQALFILFTGCADFYRQRARRMDSAVERCRNAAAFCAIRALWRATGHPSGATRDSTRWREGISCISGRTRLAFGRSNSQRRVEPESVGADLAFATFYVVRDRPGLARNLGRGPPIARRAFIGL